MFCCSVQLALNIGVEVGPRCLSIHSGNSCVVRLSLQSDFPQACCLNFEYRLLKDTVMSDPARAALHSARSAGEISDSEVPLPHNRRKSHRLT